MCLNSQLLGRAYDLCYTISDGSIGSNKEFSAIVSAFQVLDPLNVTNSVYEDFNYLIFSYFET